MSFNGLLIKLYSLKLRDTFYSGWPIFVWVSFYYITANTAFVSHFEGYGFLSARLFEKGAFYSLALVMTGVNILSVYLYRQMFFDKGLYILLILMLLWACFSTAYAGNFHYIFWLNPFMWVFGFFTISFKVPRTHLLEVFVVAVGSIIIVESFFYWVEINQVISDFTRNAISHGSADVIRIDFPTFPLHYERQQFVLPLAIIILFCFFKGGILWSATGYFFFALLVLADVRSITLAFCLAITVFYGLKYWGNWRNIVVTALTFFLVFFGMKVLINQGLGLPVGNDAHSECAITSLGGPNLAFCADYNDSGKQPEKSHLIPPTEFAPQVLMQMKGRSYNNFFSDTGGRLKIWESGLKRVQARPFLGAGKFAAPSEIVIVGMNSPYSSIGTLYHNSFIQTSVDYGVPMLVAWLLVLLHLFFKSPVAGKSIITVFGVYFFFQNEFAALQFSLPMVLFVTLLPVFNSKFPDYSGLMKIDLLGKLAKLEIWSVVRK